MTLDNFVRLVWFLAILLLVLCGIVNALLLLRLRKYHTAIWEGLGRPSLLFNASVRNQRNLGHFISSRGDRALGDSRLSLLVSCLWKAKPIIIVLLLLGFALVAVVLWRAA